MQAQRMGTILILALAFGFVAAASAFADGGKTYRVTITNLTKNQVLTPPLLVSHTAGTVLFTLGQPASSELAAIAEGGNTQPLAALLGTLDSVGDVVTGTEPILPGSTVELTVTSKERYDHLSLAGMLATTNDGFFALNSIDFPRRSATITAIAYDAGSEANTELCTDVPGPPCAADSGNQRVTAGAEGFVHVHNGIHGTGDLNAANLDWHNPVAEVVVERVK